MKKRAYSKISTIKTAQFVATIIGICLCCLLIEQIWMLNKTEKDITTNTHSQISLSVAITDSYIEQAIKVGQMLTLDLNVSKFIYQRPIEPGSSDIQTMIDTLWKLPTSKNVNPIIADIFIYSKASDYLLNSVNLFFDIDKMYPLFQFQGYSSLQFKSTFLTSKASGFFPSITAVIGSRQVRVVPYIQIFPLSNQAANTGKIMLLLDEDFISSQLGALSATKNGWYSIEDQKNGIITTTNAGYARLKEVASLPDGQHNNVSINNEKFFISVITSTVTGLRYVCAIAQKDLTSELLPLSFILPLLVLLVLTFSFIFSFKHFFTSQRNWNKLKALIGKPKEDTSYELIADTIASILKEEQKLDSTTAKHIPFKYETLFRRYVHRIQQSDAELNILFTEILGPNWQNSANYKLLKIILQEKENLSDIDDLDFLRLVTDKEANEAFHENCFVFVDYEFNSWVLVWNDNEALLNRNLKNFWEKIVKLTPFDISIAASDTKVDLKGLSQASNECNQVAETITDSNLTCVMLNYNALAARTDSYVFTADMEKALINATSSNDLQAVIAQLDSIYTENFVKRNLNPQNRTALINKLYVTAVQYNLKRGKQNLPQKYTSFADVRQFFLEKAGQTTPTKNEFEQNTTDSIVAYIEKNYSNPSLNLSVAATDLKMKENYLYHFISTRIGKTFASYLEEYRLDKAMEMLISNKDLSINAIALQCGYTNPQTFRRAFSRRFNQLPSDFRNVQ